MRGLNALRGALVLLPVGAIAACGGDAREASPSGYGEPSSSVLRDDANTSTAMPSGDPGLSALHRAEGEVCPNLRAEDFCLVDEDCRTGGPCLCAGRAGTYRWNVCAEGDCRTDADCGEGGRCSPSGGNCSSIESYYCRTPNDLCADNRDCFDIERGQAPCNFQRELGHWACASPFCPVY